MARIEWTTKDGKPCSIEVTLVTSRETSADGHAVTVPCCEMDVCVLHDGHLMGCYIDGSTYMTNKLAAAGLADYPAACGRLAIPAEPYARYRAAVAEIEAGPEWQAKLARIAEGERIEREHAAHYERVTNAMTLNGHTY